jgi:type IV secretory pathway TraG/TraD family ATPase VirD4
MAADPDQRVALFARTNYRNDQRAFGIKQADRRSHMYVVGKSGVGKSTLLEQLIRQDIEADQGVMLLDPHGDLVERIAHSVPHRRRSDLIYFNLVDPQPTVYFNPLQVAAGSTQTLTASFLLEAFKKLWPDSWGPRLEHILRQCFLALLELPSTSHFRQRKFTGS